VPFSSLFGLPPGRARRTGILFLTVLGLGLPGALRAADSAASADPVASDTPADSVVFKPLGKELSLTIGGLLQAQFDGGDQGDARFPDKNSRFYLRRARLNAAGKFKEDFEFRLEFDLAGTLAKTTGLRAQMTDGYIFWNHFTAFGVRVGQFKTPFGYEQLYADPKLFTIERSLANDRLTLNRQIGAQIEGNLADRHFYYALGAFNGNGVNNNFNDNNSLTWVGRLAVTPWRNDDKDHPASWAIGGNYLSSNDTGLSQPSEFNFDSTPATKDKDSLFTGKHTGWGVDSQLQVGPFDLWAEYLKAKFEPDSNLPHPTLETDGWYLQAAIYAVPKKLQFVAKYDTFDPDTRVGNDDTKTVTAGINYFVHSDDVKLQLDYLRADSTRLPKQNKVLARLQVIF
jgi:phosphate-selective porin OprO and OprP